MASAFVATASSRASGLGLVILRPLRGSDGRLPPVSPDTTHQFWRMERREFGLGHVLLQR
jgi:hypothetical protein